MIPLLAKLKSVERADHKAARRRAHVAICESKVRFPSKGAAKRHAKYIVSRGGLR